MGATIPAFTLLAALAGFVVGIVLGLNGFAQPAASGPIGQSPRIKNLLWLFSGLLPIFVADVGKLGLPHDFPWYWPFAGYGAGAFLGALGAIAFMSRSISQSVRALNAANFLAPPIDEHALRREYFTYGHPRFQKLLDDRRQAAEQTHRAQQEESSLESEADKTIARCTYSIFNYFRYTQSEQKKIEGDLIEDILSAIVSLVNLHSKGRLSEVRASFMVYLEPDPDLHLKCLFTNGMSTSCDGYLELKRGGGAAVRNVMLPVASIEAELLPGAPEAVASLGVSIINLQRIGFRAGVTRQVQREIRDYFERSFFKPIASVTSMVIYGGGKVHGVVNIESSAPDLLGLGESEARIVCGRLQPLVALLSIFN